MTNAEKTILILAGVALVAVVIWRNGVPDFGVAIPVDNSQQTPTDKGPAWLVYNQPWGYNAALGGVNFAVTPSRSVGQVGQVGQLGADSSFAYDCGCNG